MLYNHFYVLVDWPVDSLLIEKWNTLQLEFHEIKRVTNICGPSSL